ncbi:MAG: tyrosine-type recombinase/integrase [Spirochaetales bacterium]|nr:tyrosine-type recombinase/integrase [Spirochaetales bacterium]
MQVNNVPDSRDKKMQHEKYLEYIGSIKNLSEMTIRSYRSDLRLYQRFLEEQGLEAADVNRQKARMFVGYFKRLGHKPASINRMMSCLRGFYEYLVRFTDCPFNPFSGLKGQKDKKLLPDFLFEDEIRTLLEIDAKDFASVRDKLIFELLYSTGCRVSELCSIDVQHIDRGDHSVLVSGKGRKQRMVFLGNKAWQALLEYFPYRSARLRKTTMDNGNEGPLVLNMKGSRITVRGVSLIIRKWILKTGIRKKVSPHTFRHTFATHLLDKGADIRIVQEMLGHASLSTTQVYTHVGMARLKKAYMAAHPHAVQKR